MSDSTSPAELRRLCEEVLINWYGLEDVITPCKAVAQALLTRLDAEAFGQVTEPSPSRQEVRERLADWLALHYEHLLTSLISKRKQSDWSRDAGDLILAFPALAREGE